MIPAMLAEIPTWLAAALGVEGEVLRGRWEVLPVFGVPVTLALAVGLAVLSIWSYRYHTSELSRGRHTLLMALRVAGLACLVPALLQLSLALELSQPLKPTLAVALDTSESMGLPAKYAASAPADDGTVEGAATQPAAHGQAMPRLNAVRQALLGSPGGRLQQLARQADVQLYAFDQSARPLARGAGELAELVAGGEATALVESVETMLQRLRGSPTAGVLLLTDGVNTAGPSPEAALGDWRREGVPIHTVTVGDPHPRDIDVRQVLVDDLLFAGDPAVVLVRVRQQGFPGRRVPVILRRGEEEVARAEAVFADDAGEVNVSLTFTPREPGEDRYRVEVAPQPGEAVEVNNRQDFIARVTADRIRVLYLEQTPRWQYRFLRDAMVRDARLRPQILLAGSEPVAEPVPPMITAPPATREAFEQLDVVILGDFDPALLTGEQMGWIRDWVRDDGGGFLVLAGTRWTPRAYMDTPLAELFCVEPAENTPPGRPRASDDDLFTLRLTPLGRTHPAIQLADDGAAGAELWSALPGLYWYQPVRKIRPGAAVLAVHERETLSGGDPLPLLAVQSYGRGRSFYCGADETWRWRIRQGDRVFYRLWGQVIQYLGGGHMAGGQQAVSLRADKAAYGRGESALLTVRMSEATGTESPVVIVESPAGEQARLTPTPSSAGPRLYEAPLPLATAGLYKAWVDGHAVEASVILEVQSPRAELQTPAADEALLARIADQTGGEHALLEGIDELLAKLDLSPRAVLRQERIALWDAPWLAVAFVMLLGGEWALRRWWQLP